MTTAANMILESSVLLLDFDGVIVDSEKWQLKAWTAAIQELQIHPHKSFPVAGLLDEEIAISLTKSKSEAEQLLQLKKDIFIELFGDKYPPLVPGIIPFIKFYAQCGIIGVTSNSRKSRLIALCEHYELTRYFSVIVGARETTAPKPSPEIYKLVLKKLRRNQSEAVAIEDSLPGLVAAKRAGVIAIALPTSNTASDLIPEADAIFESFDILLQQLKKLKAKKDNNGMKKDGR